ncbi:MAG: insulinase family protein [Phycisphaerae bacterium]|nr:insulinase family protein [Phycisphaerae bacterium]
MRIRRHVWPLVGVLAATALAVGADERRYDFRKRVLPNGLTVISLEDHSCPIVAVQVWYHVGSKDEDPKRQGFAHMFEHMMFRGTDRLGPEEHFSLLRRAGGDGNAFTSFDNTTYVNSLPSNQLELALWLEAERMAFLKIDDESFYKERAVVEEERRLRSLNTPYGMVPERLLGQLFTKHPYRWTPIGQIPHLRAATIDELQKFWDTYYVPSNATLVVVGDVTHDRVHALAERYFGWIPRCADPPRITVKEPPQSKRRKIQIPEKKGPVPIIGFVYRGVPSGHPDELPLGMLMSVLGGGESSRLYKDLVKDKKLAQAAVAGAFSFEQDGLAGAGAVLLPWGKTKKVMKLISEHIARAQEEMVTTEELEKVRNQLLRSEVTQSLTVASKAGLLGRKEVLEGGADRANKRFEEIRAVTREDLLRVAKKYLVKSNESEVSVEPQLTGVLGSLLGGKEDVDEGAAPASKPAVNRIAARGTPRDSLKRPGSFPKEPPLAALADVVPTVPHEEQRLKNGLRVVVVENHEVPFITMTLGCLNGGWTETHPGTASMAASMITKGSSKHTAAEMAEELEYHAISLDGSADLDTASVSASCVSDKFDRALGLLAEVVRTPTFPEDEFEVLRKQVVLGLMVQTRTPEYLADREFRERLFGRHPYSRTPTGELPDVQALKSSDLREWWTTFIRPDASILYIAGDIRPDAAVAAARKYLEDWNVTTAAPKVRMPLIPAVEKTNIFLVDRPGSVQSQIRVGHRGITRKDAEYFPSRVLSQIFGGAFDSRLNKAIRIEKGLTYGARGGFSADRYAGTFRVSTFTKTPSTAETVRVILDEIGKLRNDMPTDEEINVARSYLVGSMPATIETPQQVVGDLWLIEFCGLPKDFKARLLDGVRRTTGDDVLRVAQRLVNPEAMVITVVGDAEKIRADLQQIAPVTVVKASVAEPADQESGRKKDEAGTPNNEDASED